MQVQKKYDLTQGNIWKTIILYGIPILVTQLIQYLYNAADTAIIGQFLGNQYMAGVSLAGITSGLFFSLIGGFTAGFAVIIGIAYGAKDREKTLRGIVMSEILCVIFAVAITVLGILFVKPLLHITKVPEECFDISYRYILVILSGTLISVFNNMHTSILRTLGDSRSPVFILTLSGVVNILLNLFFIQCTSLNEIGIAIATVLSQVVSAIAAFCVLLKKFPEYNFFRNRVKWVKGEWIWAEQIKMGIPMAFQNSLIMIGAIIVQTAVNQLGTQVIAVYAAANSINNLASTLINTFGMVIAGYVSQNYGAKDYERIKTGVWDCLVLSWVLAAVIAFILLVFTRPIAGLYINPEEWTEEIYADIRTFLLINVAFYAIWVPVPIFRSSIQSMKNTLLPFLSCLVELPMRCGTAWVLGKYFGFLGISWATPCALIAAFLFLTISYLLVLKKKKKEFLWEKSRA